MGYSRASKESMALNGTIPKSRYQHGGNVDCSMSKNDFKKAALHKDLPTSTDKKRTQSVVNYRNP
jgi:hypothetical protein